MNQDFQFFLHVQCYLLSFYQIVSVFVKKLIYSLFNLCFTEQLLSIIILSIVLK